MKGDEKSVFSLAGGVGKIFVFLEGQGCGIHAKAEMSGFGAIIESVAEMRIATGAKNFSAVHAVT
jgi:hypothetical protein